MPSDPRPPLIVILGPTAVGKTETALQLAERLDGEIISADSRLFYRGMNIGTAKPTPAEQARVLHHLIGVADPDETWSLATFQHAAYEAVHAAHQRGRLPFLVGGTGQYIRSVTEGWEIPRQAPDPRLRAALEGWAGELGADELHARLRVLDPAAAARIDARNLRRTVRALEVIFRTGRRFSEQRRQSAPAYCVLQIGLLRPRPELYARVDARIEQMLADGLVAEVQGLLARGYSAALPSLSAIGYGEIVTHLHGEITLEEAVMLIKRRTRQFVRRQANWFKETDPNIHWFRADAGRLDEILTLIRGFLSGIGFGES